MIDKRLTPNSIVEWKCKFSTRNNIINFDAALPSWFDPCRRVVSFKTINRYCLIANTVFYVYYSINLSFLFPSRRNLLPIHLSNWWLRDWSHSPFALVQFCEDICECTQIPDIRMVVNRDGRSLPNVGINHCCQSGQNVAQQGCWFFHHSMNNTTSAHPIIDHIFHHTRGADGAIILLCGRGGFPQRQVAEFWTGVQGYS